MALDKPRIYGRTLGELSQADLFMRKDPSGKLRDVTEVLNQTNQILDDMVWKEGNLEIGHEYALRTSLPHAWWARINRGVPASKSEVAILREACGRMESRCTIDARQLEREGAKSVYRYDEDMAHVEGISQQMANAIFYADNPIEGFIGFAPRYNTKTVTAKNPQAKNVIDCGGTGPNLTSIWIIGWSPKTVYGFYPKGSKLGLQMDDKGLQRVLDDKGNPYYAYETLFSWHMGLAVEDWRSVVRLANINIQDVIDGKGIGTGNLTPEGSQNLITLLNRGIDLLGNRTSTRTAIYMHPDVHTALKNTAIRSNQNVITIQESVNAYGRSAMGMNFGGVPVRVVEQLSKTETQIQ